MKKLLLVFIGLCLLFNACSRESNSEVVKQKVVTGILEHYPPGVKSAQAWAGHEFVVEATPVKASGQVSAEALKALVGSKVRVTGLWNPGKKWEPTKNEQMMPTPAGVTRMVGEGLEALEVVKLD